MIKLAILTPINSYEFLKKSLFNLNINLEYIFYNSLYDLEELYIKNAQNYDGIITSGPIGYEIIKKRVDLTTPLYYFDISKGDLYKFLFQFLKKNPEANFSKVYIDFISAEKKEEWLSDFFSKEDEPIFYKIDYSEKNLYEVFRERYVKLLKLQKLDFVLTRLSNMVSFLENEKIPFYFLFPSEENIRNTVLNAIKDINLSKAKHKQIVIGRIEYTHSLEILGEDIHSICKNSIVQTGDNFLEILVLFEDFKNSNLALEFQKKTPKGLNIGWGVGNNIQEARFYAKNSYKKNKEHGGKILFLYSGIQVTILSPIKEKEKKQIKILEDLHELNIRKENSRKLLECFRNSKKMSSKELANYLEVSERTTNRMLAKLEENHLVFAETIKLKKGRPKKVYQFIFSS